MRLENPRQGEFPKGWSSMLEPTVRQILSWQILDDRLREAEKHRFAQLATSDRNSFEVKVARILSRIRPLFTAARRNLVRPFVTPPG